MTGKGDHEPSQWCKCERALQTQDKLNEFFPVENNLSSALCATLQPRSATFFDETRGIYWQVTWLVISNVVLLQYEYSRKKPLINPAAL